MREHAGQERPEGGRIECKPARRRARRLRVGLIAAVAAIVALTATVLAASGELWSHEDNVWPYAKTYRAPVLAAVGDISCQPGGPVEGEKQNGVPWVRRRPGFVGEELYMCV